MAINQRSSKAMMCMKEHGLTHTEKLRPQDLLVHTSNRAGQMVNSWDVWSKGIAISEVGWDKNKIREPVAVELPHDAAARHAMILANTNLHEQSNGMLAKPSGKERCCTISASHTTSFLKALACECTMDNENTSVEQLMAKQDDLAELLSEGWMWTIISEQVELHVPALPSLLQQAFNSHLVRLVLFVCSLFLAACWWHIGCHLESKPSHIEVTIVF